jgi:hypothetical protein
MLLALAAGWFAPPAHSFEQRFIRLPAAMNLEMFNAARKAAARPTAREGYCYPKECLNG